MNEHMNELLRLKDYELIYKVRDSIIDEIHNFPSEEDIHNFPDIKFLMITASLFDLEMQNGGLCQFLTNQGYYHGPDLINALDAFGAVDHRDLIADFFEKCSMDTDFFDELPHKERDPYVIMEFYSDLSQRYPFREFENAYFELDRNSPLETILGTYLRNNLSVFI